MKKEVENNKGDAKNIAHLEAKKWLMNIKSKPLTKGKNEKFQRWLAEDQLNKREFDLQNHKSSRG